MIDALSRIRVDVLSLVIPTPIAIAPDRFATEPAEASAIAVICDLPFDLIVTPSLPDRLAFSSTNTVALFSVTDTAATKAAPAEFD